MNTTIISKFALVGLIFFSILIGSFSANISIEKSLNVNITDLLPSNELFETQDNIQKKVSNDFSKFIFIRLDTHTANYEQQNIIAKSFLTKLDDNSVFLRSELMNKLPDNLTKWIDDNKLLILLPNWLESKEAQYHNKKIQDKTFIEWLANDAVEELNTYLDNPESVAYMDNIQEDPFLLIPNFIKQSNPAAEINGFDSNQLIHIWAEIKDSSLNSDVQMSVEKTINEAYTATKSYFPAIEMMYSGVSKFAKKSELGIRNEVSRLNILSISLIVLVLVIFLRKPYIILPVVGVVLAALAGSFLLTYYFFGQVHLFTLVVGSILSGVSVDYAFHIILKRESLKLSSYTETIQNISRPLFMSWLTTVCGFSVLLFSELFILRQIGAFVAIGITLSLLFSVLVYSALDLFKMKHIRMDRGLSWKQFYINPTAKYIVIIFLLAVSIYSISQLQFRDDVRDLQVPLHILVEEQQQMSEKFSQLSNKDLLIVYNKNIHALADNLRTLVEQSDIDAINIAKLLPSKKNIHNINQFVSKLESFKKYFNKSLTEHGYYSDEFDEFIKKLYVLKTSDLNQKYISSIEKLTSALHGPMQLVLFKYNELYCASVKINKSNLLKNDIKNSFIYDEIGRLNLLFRNYRLEAQSSAATGVVMIIVFVLLFYKLKSFVRVLFIPIISVVISTGTVSLLQIPFSLFGLVGTLLGFCLVLDYSLFSVSTPKDQPLLSIRMSAISTLVVFTVLATSNIPAVSLLGLIVSIIVLTGFTLVEFDRTRIK